MIFGNKDCFAIEVGNFEMYPESSGIYAQFRFWVGAVPIGDWNDRIPFFASIEYARRACEMEQRRLGSPIVEQLPDAVFETIYDNYYRLDYDSESEIWATPDYREVFHLDGIGMGAVQDKYGLILFAASHSLERVIAKDLRKELYLADVSMPLGFAESAMCEYVEWGHMQINLYHTKA